ncbi:hypothetical protein V5E97_25485 [Singulisphaera sp. Ch08]|uniref:PH domain-containing protein n=1 Tax=Singulisphaera sp. Ch08 TaxID=3120278 RepID=A0AAU7C8I2_9BACT
MPAFVCFHFLSVIGFTILEFVLLAVIFYSLGLRWNQAGLWVSGLGYANAILSTRVVDALLIRMGRSRSGKTVEVRGRTIAHAEGIAGGEDVLEVYGSRSLYHGLIAMCLGICVMTLAVLFLFLPHDRMSGSDWGYSLGLIALFGAIAIGLWCEKRKGRVCADGEGILACPTGFCFRRRFVPWSEIATCEIETRYDTFGRPVIIRPVLKDQGGRALLTPDLQTVRFEDQERLVRYIRARLPKPKADLLDF